MVRVRMPDDHFSLIAASTEHVYTLTVSGLLYYLPRDAVRSKAPVWLVRPMPRVSKIVSVHNRQRLDCLALLADGTLWRLDPDARMPTFRSGSKPEYLLADDVFPSLQGYYVLRYKRLAVEFVPWMPSSTPR
jgi:hypothetical protein